jgi:hypothetical protein
MKKIITSIIILFLGISMTMPMVFGFVNLYGANGYLFDIDEKYGYLYNGTADAYDYMYHLTVNGTEYYSSGTYTTELGGRQVILPVVNISGLNVQRKIFIPATENWARYLEIINNPTGSPIKVNVNVHGDLGSDYSTYLIKTSSTDYNPPLLVTSGGIVLDPNNFWAATDDSSDGEGDPSLAHVWDGQKGKDHIDYLRLYDGDYLEYYWNNITIAPGQTVVIMHFAVQETNRANSISTAKELYDNDGNLNHIMYASEPGSRDIEYVINWGTRYQNKELPMQQILKIVKENQED